MMDIARGDATATQSLASARQDYLSAAGLGDGGYEDDWVKLKMGPIPIAFPNSPSRKAAVPRHDLNHVLTAYKTDWPGEFEISAFELASGCRHYWAAWVLNMGGLIGGMVVWPRRTLSAFWRGCQSQNTYYVDEESEILDLTVAEARKRLAIAEPDVSKPASRADVFRFAKIFALSLFVYLSVLTVLAAPLVGGYFALR